MTPLPDLFDPEADLELFRSLGDGHEPHWSSDSGHWELGFGPVGGNRPIWGLYYFIGGRHVLHNLVLLWRQTPSARELARWCTNTVGAEVATRLLEAVGDLTSFYDVYFTSRQDLVRATGEAQWIV